MKSSRTCGWCAPMDCGKNAEVHEARGRREGEIRGLLRAARRLDSLHANSVWSQPALEFGASWCRAEAARLRKTLRKVAGR